MFYLCGMKSIFLFLIIISLFSCKSDREKMDDLSYDILDTTINELKSLQADEENSEYREIKKSIYNIKSDSVIDLYYKIRLDSSELALDYSYDFKHYIQDIRNQLNWKYDSLMRISERKKEIKAQKEEKKWWKSKAGRIHRKHPNWSRGDCEGLANRQICIGMHIDMVKYLRGLPNHVNTSNYGNGNSYQMCWDDYNPSCFYCESDGIVTSYN